MRLVLRMRKKNKNIIYDFLKNCFASYYRMIRYTKKDNEKWRGNAYNQFLTQSKRVCIILFILAQKE